MTYSRVASTAGLVLALIGAWILARSTGHIIDALGTYDGASPDQKQRSRRVAAIGWALVVLGVGLQTVAVWLAPVS